MNDLKKIWNEAIRPTIKTEFEKKKSYWDGRNFRIIKGSDFVLVEMGNLNSHDSWDDVLITKRFIDIDLALNYLRDESGAELEKARAEFKELGKFEYFKNHKGL